MTIQPSSIILLGVLLLALVTVESGGWFLTRVARGAVPANALQVKFFRAGHAHAAVLLVLSFAIVGSIHASALTGVWLTIGSSFVPIAALLMPAGFFLSVIGKDPQQPNRAVVLLWAGVAILTVGLLTAGIGFLIAGIAAI